MKVFQDYISKFDGPEKQDSNLVDPLTPPPPLRTPLLQTRSFCAMHMNILSRLCSVAASVYFL